GLAGVVGERGHHGDGLALVALEQRVGGRGGAGNGDAVAPPLVTRGAGLVAGHGRRGGQGLALDGTAGDRRHRQGRRRIHHRRGRGAGLRHGLAGVVGERGHHGDGLALVALEQRVGGRGGAGNGDAVALPLVGRGAGLVAGRGRRGGQ